MPFGSFGNNAAQQQGSIGKGLKYRNRSRFGINLNRYLLDDVSGLRTVFSDTILTNYARNNFWIRVRRASDNAEQDFVYKNGIGDYASLLTFCSSTDGYIAKRYNQVQSKNDLTIADTAKQQQIVSAGALLSLTDKRILYEPANSSLSVYDELLSINSRMNNLDSSSYVVCGDDVSVDLTEYNNDYVFPINCSAGLMDFSITNGNDVHWYLQDGTTSSASRPSTILGAGVSYLFASNFLDNNIEISDITTNANYIGNLLDAPRLTYYFRLQGCSAQGDLSNAPPVSYYLNLDNCDVSGAFQPQATTSYIELDRTLMSSDDTDQTLINLANVTTVTGGTLVIINNRTSASDAAYTYLTTTKSWTITEL